MKQTPHNNYNPKTGASQSRARQVVPILAGAAISAFGLSRKSKSGLALAAAGGALVYIGARNQGERELLAHAGVLLNSSPMKAFMLYRNFEDLPIFMHHLESVTKLTDERYQWIALGPLGTEIKWDTEIVDEREGEFISWHTLPGSDFTAEGSVQFKEAPGNRGTILTSTFHYDIPAGRLGTSLLKLLGKNASFKMQQDLRRFKALVETGEMPTTEGQSHGPRSAVTAALRLANPDEPIKRDARMSEVFNAKRRTA
jgi:uncharacterized membrane protein